MTALHPSARLKMKRDTFYVPDAHGSVYFRNNTSSFRMEGESVDQWIEQLLPLFNGEHTMDYLTDELPESHANRIYEIAGMLYKNGFANDVSVDRPHQLPEQVQRRYASQIEFLEQFVPSAAFRFQTYRESRVLAVGCGPLYVSLIASLLETGLPKLHMLITDGEPTDRSRLTELAAFAREHDPEVSLEELTIRPSSEQPSSRFWQETVAPFDAVIYVSRGDDVRELLSVHAACKEENKRFAPAVYLSRAGLAGPLIHPGQDTHWESAWRRLHSAALNGGQPPEEYSSTAGAMLSHIVVFELLKHIAGVNETAGKRQFYLLDLETLEGSWHLFEPHPLAEGSSLPAVVEEAERRLEPARTDNSEWLARFGRLVSPVSGVFHVWDEGELNQLPLSQCRIQPADPLSEGPAERLAEIACADLTHEGARREAALAGVEAYVRRWTDSSSFRQEWEASGFTRQCLLGIGAGETAAEAMARALQSCLGEQLRRTIADRPQVVAQARIVSLEDVQSRYYFQALSRMRGTPVIALGQAVHGLPVVWVGTEGQWFGSPGLNVTLALREALREAVQQEQNRSAGRSITARGLVTKTATSVYLNEASSFPLETPSCDNGHMPEAVRSALQTLKSRIGHRLVVLDMASEPFLREELAAVFGVVVREGVSR